MRQPSFAIGRPYNVIIIELNKITAMTIYRITLVLLIFLNIHFAIETFIASAHGAGRGCAMQCDLHELKNTLNENVFDEIQTKILSFHQKSVASLSKTSFYFMANILISILLLLIDAIKALRDNKRQIRRNTNDNKEILPSA